MPTYQYFCDNCRHRFKRVESISAHEQHRKPACPKCRSKRVSRVFSGFYPKTGKKS
ncbi:MAG: zinc ribbon domain-containing protein [Gemmatimonadetes bacterium]|nr:zinc ribbon domain-containing protein [Gemmatimonadota bacterium]